MTYQITKKFLTFFIGAFFMIFSALFVSAQSDGSARAANTAIATSVPAEPPSSFPYFLVALAAAFVIAPYGMARILSRANEKNRP